MGTAGQQMGNFKAISAALGADEMKGPLSRGQRPKAIGNRGGCHSGGIEFGEVVEQEARARELGRERADGLLELARRSGRRSGRAARRSRAAPVQ